MYEFVKEKKKTLHNEKRDKIFCEGLFRLITKCV